MRHLRTQPSLFSFFSRGLFFSLLSLLILASSIWPINIIITGSWAEVIDAADLQGPAGSDLNPTYESLTNQISIDIRNTQNRIWTVDVRKVDLNWHSNFVLSVRRTSNGSGNGWISGGLSYIVVDSSDKQFFRGRNNRRSIHVQLKLDGVSIEIPPGIYSTTIYYTAIEVF